MLCVPLWTFPEFVITQEKRNPFYRKSSEIELSNKELKYELMWCDSCQPLPKDKTVEIFGCNRIDNIGSEWNKHLLHNYHFCRKSANYFWFKNCCWFREVRKFPEGGLEKESPKQLKKRNEIYFCFGLYLISNYIFLKYIV